MKREPLQMPGALISVMDRHADRFAAQRFKDLGVGKAHLQFIGSLVVEGDDVPQEQLASRMAMDKSAVARALQKLEELGLVRRAADPEDARRKRVLLTARARRLWPRLLDALEDWSAILMDGLNARERAQALRLLSRMRDNAVNFSTHAMERRTS